MPHQTLGQTGALGLWGRLSVHGAKDNPESTSWSCTSCTFGLGPDGDWNWNWRSCTQESEMRTKRRRTRPASTSTHHCPPSAPLLVRTSTDAGRWFSRSPHLAFGFFFCSVLSVLPVLSSFLCVSRRRLSPQLHASLRTLRRTE